MTTKQHQHAEHGIALTPDLLVERMRHAYFNEGLALVGEGIAASTVEAAGRTAGFIDGPLALLDEAGLARTDQLYHAVLAAQSQGCCHHHDHEHSHKHEQGHGHGHHAEHAHSCFGHDHEHAHTHEHGHDSASAATWFHLSEEGAYVMEKMAHGLQRMGRADGGGFYEYDDDEDDERELWSGLKAFVRRGVSLPAAEIEDRLRFAPVLALLRARVGQAWHGSPDAPSAHAAHPGHATGHREEPASPSASLSTMAANSRLWPLGHDPFSLINTLGTTAFAARAHELQTRHGERFALPVGWEEAI